MSETRSAVERKMERISAPSFSAEDILDRRDRRDRRQRAMAGVIAFALFLPVVAWWFVAQSHDGHRAANGVDVEAAFVRDASGICAAGRAEFDRQTPLTAPRGDWSFAQLVEYEATGIPVFRDVISRLRELSPPPRLARLFKDAVDLHERSIDTIARAVRAGRAGERHTFRHMIERVFGTMDHRLVGAYEGIDPALDCP